jgi:hypothetical protein
MSRRQYLVVLAVAVVSGLAGGLLSPRLLTGRPAQAQVKYEPAEQIQARKFVVVGENGVPVAALTTRHGNPAVVVLDELVGVSGWVAVEPHMSGTVSGKPVSFGLNLALYGWDGRRIWSAPAGDVAGPTGLGAGAGQPKSPGTKRK